MWGGDWGGGGKRRCRGQRVGRGEGSVFFKRMYF